MAEAQKLIEDGPTIEMYVRMELEKNRQLAISVSFRFASPAKKKVDFELYQLLCDHDDWQKMVILVIAENYDVDSLFFEVDEIVDNDTPLSVACKFGAINHVRALVMLGAEINDRASIMTPLQYACSYGKLDVAKVLICNGASVDCLYSHIETKPVCLALKSSLEVLKLLVYNGAEFSLHSSHHRQEKICRLVDCAKIAIRYQRLDGLRFLLAAGLNVNYKDGQSGVTDDILSELAISSLKEPALLELYQILSDYDCKLSTQHIINIPFYPAKCLLSSSVFRPKLLQEYSRLVIRSRMVSVTRGLSIIENIQNLPLPEKLKDFLRFDVPFEKEYIVAKRVWYGKSQPTYL